jgi:DNA-binding YbaB/EbfC family protein
MNRGMMRQFQNRLNKIQEELGNLELEASSGGGAIKVTVDGQQNLKSIKISAEVINAEDVELLEDMILTAVNDAMNKSREAAAKQLGGLTGGLKIPGLM